MPRRTAALKAGVPKPVPLKLPADLALDLQAFCEAHFNAPQNRVICAAVRRFIDSEVESDIVASERYRAARQRLLQARTANAGDPLRLVTRAEPAEPGET
jgi:hypothetical protein